MRARYSGRAATGRLKGGGTLWGNHFGKNHTKEKGIFIYGKTTKLRLREVGKAVLKLNDESILKRHSYECLLSCDLQCRSLNFTVFY